MKAKIGTRIKFIKTLEASATGDHPDIIYARKDEEGEITGHDAKEGYMVKMDSWDASFGAILGEEFIPLTLKPNQSKELNL